MLKLQKVKILNIEFDNITSEELLKKLSQEGGVVFTPNVDHLVQLQKDREFYETYRQANYRTCDSKILIYAAQLLGTPIVEKVSGSDFFPAFYQYNKNNQDVKIFLLGAAEGVASKAQEIINEKVGREIIINVYSPPFGFEKDEAECSKIVDLINESEATVLAIGVGAPKQEKWLCKYKDELTNIKIFLAIGATIDFEAGAKKRSPKWMSNLGIEWLHRLASEPQRLAKRYLIEDLPFFGLIMQQKLGLYKSPFLDHEESLKESSN